MMRTCTNGELRAAHIGQQVTLVGWVSKRRNFGQLVFIDLRDRYGITQIVFNESLTEAIKDVRNEYILQVSGEVVKRQDPNLKMATGEIEVAVKTVKILNSANTTPLIIADETDALEEVRLKYRYLDLRRPVVQQKFILRHQINRSIRKYLDERDFVEVETPILTRSTPEGARDYLVPSRIHEGQFYALPQSPQLFKQLLMISGLERYYQIARCFRDEDLRADRQMEFTQVDIETSFLSQDELLKLMEGMMASVMKEFKGIDLPLPFVRLTFAQAMNTYGSDKPDIRFELKLTDVSEIFKNSEFSVFSTAFKNQGVIKALCVPGLANASRKQTDKYADEAKKNGAKGLVVLKVTGGALEGSAAKFFSAEESKALLAALKASDNDLILMAAGQWEPTCNALGAVRSYLGSEQGLYDKETFAFLWVTEFPMLEYNEEDKRFYARHHPFTRPMDEDVQYLDSDPARVRAYAYDMVLNGYELGGGSLRIYDQKMQTKMFELLGFSEEQIKARFGFFIEAFQYGTPPHGGIAFGLDRIAMLLTGSESLRDVIAFPKNAAAKCPMSEAPSSVEESQLAELHIKVTQ
ncbi:MAG: aspartate--tRNA ligase [Erysipelotrichaceae bacterium]|jgi:aspartyl-tRNA synthetase|nr:aspartate--tRNA ligase [Erysipelotrichaceae bacterium]